MSFIIKQTIEKLLSDIIQNQNIEYRQRKILELKAILKIIISMEKDCDNFKGVKKVHRLPDSKTSYSEFRVIDDVDSEDRSLWIELEDLKLSQGDLIIEMK
ncbi:MAG: hypothetical protein R2798_05975 [Chitinophagales bacterium]|nr:hypothetical protein [Bacteroidota bacterium]